jgi:4'-phosphopantetheinyl transferase
LANTASFGPVHCAWWPWRRSEVAESRVRAWLGEAWGLPPESLLLTRDAFGRPHLDGGSDHAALKQVDLNWSHSGDWLIAAYAEGAQIGGIQIGIDIELLQPRPKALALAQRFFAPAETAWLARLADDPVRLEHTFTRLWCAKEAVLKAHGRGLSFGLEKLRFDLGENDDALRLVDCDAALGTPGDWRLDAWSPVPGYLATLACRALAVGGASAPSSLAGGSLDKDRG